MFWVHEAQVWDSMHGPENKCGNSRPSCCVAQQHGSRILRILAHVSQPGSGNWQPLPRKVCACEALCCCEKKHAHCGSSIFVFIDPSVFVWWNQDYHVFHLFHTFSISRIHRAVAGKRDNNPTGTKGEGDALEEDLEATSNVQRALWESRPRGRVVFKVERRAFRAFSVCFGEPAGCGHVIRSAAWDCHDDPRRRSSVATFAGPSARRSTRS